STDDAQTQGYIQKLRKLAQKAAGVGKQTGSLEKEQGAEALLVSGELNVKPLQVNLPVSPMQAQSVRGAMEETQELFSQLTPAQRMWGIVNKIMESLAEPAAAQQKGESQQLSPLDKAKLLSLDALADSASQGKYMETTVLLDRAQHNDSLAVQERIRSINPRVFIEKASRGDFFSDVKFLELFAYWGNPWANEFFRTFNPQVYIQKYVEHHNPSRIMDGLELLEFFDYKGNPFAKEFRRTYNPLGLFAFSEGDSRLSPEEKERAVEIMHKLTEAENITAAYMIANLASQGNRVAEFYVSRSTNNIVLGMRQAHLEEGMSYEELERQVSLVKDVSPYLLLNAYISRESFGDLAKILFIALRVQAESKGMDMPSFLKELDPGGQLYTQFILQAANFGQLDDMIFSAESLNAVLDDLFNGLDGLSIQDYAVRLALLTEGILKDENFLYQQGFQEHLKMLYDTTSGFKRSFIGALLFVYKDNFGFLNREDLNQIGKEFGTPSTRVDYSKLLNKDSKILVHIVFADDDAAKNFYAATADLFQGKNTAYPNIKGYRLVSASGNRIVLEKGDIQLVLIRANEEKYDINQHINEVGMIESRSHANNEGSVFKRQNVPVNSEGKILFVSSCRSATGLSSMARQYSGASLIGINSTAYGMKTNIFTYYLLEALNKRTADFTDIKSFIAQHLARDSQDYVMPSDRAFWVDAIIRGLLEGQDQTPAEPVLPGPETPRPNLGRGAMERQVDTMDAIGQSAAALANAGNITEAENLFALVMINADLNSVYFRGGFSQTEFGRVRNMALKGVNHIEISRAVKLLNMRIYAAFYPDEKFPVSFEDISTEAESLLKMPGVNSQPDLQASLQEVRKAAREKARQAGTGKGENTSSPWQIPFGSAFAWVSRPKPKPKDTNKPVSAKDPAILGENGELDGEKVNEAGLFKAMREVIDDTRDGFEAFHGWYRITKRNILRMLRKVSLQSEEEGITRLHAYLVIEKENAMASNLGLALKKQSPKAKGDERKTLLELGAGNTDTALEIARKNSGIDVIATDEYQDDPSRARSEYLPYAIGFNQGDLAAQKAVKEEGIVNLAVARATADMLLFVHDNSYDHILVVNPSVIVLKDLIVLIREYQALNKLKEGGSIVLKMRPALERYIKLISRYTDVSVEGNTFLGVDLENTSDFKQEELRGNVYVIKKKADPAMLGENGEIDGESFLKKRSRLMFPTAEFLREILESPNSPFTEEEKDAIRYYRVFSKNAVAQKEIADRWGIKTNAPQWFMHRLTRVRERVDLIYSSVLWDRKRNLLLALTDVADIQKQPVGLLFLESPNWNQLRLMRRVLHIDTIGDLAEKTEDEIFGVRNLGRQMVDNVKAALGRVGMSLSSVSEVERLRSLPDLADRSVFQLSQALSSRALAAVSRAYHDQRIRTVGDLANEIDGKFPLTRSVWKKTISEVRSLLSEIGMLPGESVPEGNDPAMLSDIDFSALPEHLRPSSTTARYELKNPSQGNHISLDQKHDFFENQRYGQFFWIPSSEKEGEVYLLPVANRFFSSDLGTMYLGWFFKFSIPQGNWERIKLNDLKVTKPCRLKKTAKGWDIVEEGYIEIKEDSEVGRRGKELQRQEDEKKQARKLTSVTLTDAKNNTRQISQGDPVYYILDRRAIPGIVASIDSIGRTIRLKEGKTVNYSEVYFDELDALEAAKGQQAAIGLQPRNSIGIFQWPFKDALGNTREVKFHDVVYVLDHNNKVILLEINDIDSTSARVYVNEGNISIPMDLCYLNKEDAIKVANSRPISPLPESIILILDDATGVFKAVKSGDTVYRIEAGNTVIPLLIN
ncbi:MAG: hypothetical protein HQL27_08740, partial [Candidatus Omnitrophica bacterium]|nr:hypothetical protein [Candidatus Omnitrophota bacterium]